MPAVATGRARAIGTERPLPQEDEACVRSGAVGALPSSRTPQRRRLRPGSCRVCGRLLSSCRKDAPRMAGARPGSAGAGDGRDEKDAGIKKSAHMCAHWLLSSSQNAEGEEARTCDLFSAPQRLLQPVHSLSRSLCSSDRIFGQFRLSLSSASSLVCSLCPSPDRRRHGLPCRDCVGASARPGASGRLYSCRARAGTARGRCGRRRYVGILLDRIVSEAQGARTSQLPDANHMDVFCTLRISIPIRSTRSAPRRTQPAIGRNRRRQSPEQVYSACHTGSSVLAGCP